MVLTLLGMAMVKNAITMMSSCTLGMVYTTFKAILTMVDLSHRRNNQTLAL